MATSTLRRGSSSRRRAKQAAPGRAAHDSGRFAAGALPGALVDTYGAGDSFAAGLTYALARGDALDEALAFASAQGAEAMTRRGAHGNT